MVVVAAGTVATVAAGTAVAITTGTVVATLTTRGTLAALGLYVAFGLGLEGTHRQSVLAGLFVDFDEFYLYLVTFLKAGSLHVFETLPRDFGYVEQTVAVGHELNKRTEVEYRAYLALI